MAISEGERWEVYLRRWENRCITAFVEAGFYGRALEFMIQKFNRYYPHEDVQGWNAQLRTRGDQIENGVWNRSDFSMQQLFREGEEKPCKVNFWMGKPNFKSALVWERENEGKGNDWNMYYIDPDGLPHEGIMAKLKVYELLAKI